MIVVAYEKERCKKIEFKICFEITKKTIGYYLLILICKLNDFYVQIKKNIWRRKINNLNI